MSHLNYHLFAIHKIESPECKCGHHKEDTTHFLLHCPDYQLQRTIMFNEISLTLNVNFINVTPRRQVDTLLFGTDLDSGDGTAVAVALSFQKFLLASNRFSAT